METTNNQSETTATKPLFMRMEEETEFSQMTLEQQEIYMRSLDTWRTVMAAEEFTFQKGRAEGHAEGEVAKAFAIARNLIAMNMTVEQVAQATGLSAEEINSL